MTRIYFLRGIMPFAAGIVLLSALETRALADSSAPKQAVQAVTLPHSIDPAGRFKGSLARGTQVFADHLFLVEYTTTEGGKQIDHLSQLRDVTSVQRTPNALSVTVSGKQTLQFPSSAKISDDPSHIVGFAFVSPGKAVPDIFKNKKPDYIVP
jgi:hypothetical protein